MRLMTTRYTTENFFAETCLYLSHPTSTHRSVIAASAMKSATTPVKWVPTPGAIATYAGRAGNGKRLVRVLAEAVKGRMYVEAIGRLGFNVKFTVKRESLTQPQPDLFD